MSETASGWQQANFSSPVAVTADTVNLPRITRRWGRYAIDSGHFSASGVNNGPLDTLRDGADGGNGVHQYGASSFPTRTWRSSNYWVDVVFTPAN